MITHSPHQPERSGDSLSRAIRLSIGLHVLALLALFLKELIIPSAPNVKEYLPSLKVDLVALPDQKAAEVTTPIQPTAPEETKPPEEAKKAEEKVEPVKEPAKTETADYSLKKKQAKTKAEKAEAEREEARERMKNALARIKALEKIRAGELIKGNKVMTGSSAKGVAMENAETVYQDIVRERVSSEWELPLWLQGKNLSAKVHIRIDRRGMISIVRFIKTSGNAQFDAAVKHTLQSASPLPAPPISILPTVSQDGIVLGFPIID
jgi:outer membrane biosynthesis protein TonB